MTGPERSELHAAIREARTRYQAGGSMPDWQALDGMLAVERERVRPVMA